MFTLLPLQHKKSLYKEYRARLVIVVCFFLTVFFAIGMALLFPSKIYLVSEKEINIKAQSVLDERIKIQNEKGLVETLSSIKDTLVSVNPEETAIVPVMGIVLEKLPQGVSLESFVYVRGESAPSSLNIKGVAKTRNDLISFSKSLKSEPLFTEIVLPLSNLAKQEEVSFSLTLLGQF